MRFRDASSPNQDARPAETVIDTLVIHATVLDSLDEVIGHFANPASKVSAHYTIDRDGTVAVHVPEEMRAWHAGVSKMKDGRPSVNNFSIGIELVNRNDGEDPFSAAQIDAMRELAAAIITRHPIQHIVPHYEIADPPGRKSDPVGFRPSWFDGIFGRSIKCE
jgi:N-acetyl-anhydromuramyl-L-alanine amidase AmpD